MSDVTIIYPHQLYQNHPALDPARPVFIIEEPLLMTEFPVHRQKLLLLRLAMQAYQKHLSKAGYAVKLLELKPDTTTESQLKQITDAGYTTLHVADTTDDWLEKRLANTTEKYNCRLIRYPSPLFILNKTEAIARYQSSHKHLARFYQTLRRDLNILMDEDGKPVGGRFSFDSDNRKKLPARHPIPPDPVFIKNQDVEEAVVWLSQLPGDHYGEAEVWLPYTHDAALKWLEDFLNDRLQDFGPYEDALTTHGVRLFHSALSPLLNIGLLSPQKVIDMTLKYADKHTTHLPSLEGFIRQVLGWREFIRASYECDGRIMRTSNFWRHQRPLPRGWWTGKTGLLPIDHTIKNALKYGYNHHIERLMVLGNYLLLTETNPHEVYRWFMATYVDAYDWVMVPNVYGMSQFADAGSFASKPYISGSNYLRKMSDYQDGEWTTTFDALYWHFIAKHEAFFQNNHRLSMMPKLLNKMNHERRSLLLKQAQHHLDTIA
jgi:deoxyribodipyrimidine photolyase-related protein